MILHRFYPHNTHSTCPTLHGIAGRAPPGRRPRPTSPREIRQSELASTLRDRLRSLRSEHRRRLGRHRERRRGRRRRGRGVRERCGAGANLLGDGGVLSACRGQGEEEEEREEARGEHCAARCSGTCGANCAGERWRRQHGRQGGSHGPASFARAHAACAAAHTTNCGAAPSARLQRHASPNPPRGARGRRPGMRRHGESAGLPGGVLGGWGQPAMRRSRLQYRRWRR